MIKPLNKLQMEENYFSITKAICEKPTASILLNTEKLKAFPLLLYFEEQYKDTHCCHFYSIHWKFLSHQLGKKSKRGNQIRRGETKVLEFAGDMLFYLEIPKDFPLSVVLEVVTEFSKGAGCKNNIHNSFAFFTLTSSKKDKVKYYQIILKIQK